MGAARTPQPTMEWLTYAVAVGCLAGTGVAIEALLRSRKTILATGTALLPVMTLFVGFLYLASW